MRTASSASRTCSASASASEYTATVAMPSRLQVRMTRQAISPRLATRIFVKGIGAAPAAGAAFAAPRALPAFFAVLAPAAFFFAAIAQSLPRKISIAIATWIASGAPHATATHIHQG